MGLRRIRQLVTVAIIATFVSGIAQGAQQAGQVEFARGVATAQQANKAPRILAQGQRFFSGEVLSTSKRSFAVIKLEDGSRMTLRPNTQFVVEDINATRNANANAVLRLFKGGIRALTGFISKANKDGYRLETPVATMGIRGTEFDARLCSGDCETDGDTATAKFRSARVAFARGQVSLKTNAGKQQQVKTGIDIRPGQRLQAGNNGIAVLVFPDDSRVTLQPRSEFVIRSYGYNKASVKDSESVLELLRGGLRVVTGLIGKIAPDNYQVRTPVATIGIRGTGFDLLCKNNCIEVQSSQWQPETVIDRLVNFVFAPVVAASLPENGMYAFVWDGKIRLRTQNDAFNVAKGKAIFLANPVSKPINLPKVPQFMLDNPFPRPDNVMADPNKMFPKQPPPQDTQPGLYVSVYDGEVAVEDKILRRGDVSFTDPSAKVTKKLPRAPEFMRTDPFPKPSDFKPSVYRLLNAIDKPQDQDGFECEVQ